MSEFPQMRGEFSSEKGEKFLSSMEFVHPKKFSVKKI